MSTITVIFRYSAQYPWASIKYSLHAFLLANGYKFHRLTDPLLSFRKFFVSAQLSKLWIFACHPRYMLPEGNTTSPSTVTTLLACSPAGLHARRTAKWLDPLLLDRLLTCQPHKAMDGRKFQGECSAWSNTFVYSIVTALMFSLAVQRSSNCSRGRLRNFHTSIVPSAGKLCVTWLLAWHIDNVENAFWFNPGSSRTFTL